MPPKFRWLTCPRLAESMAANLLVSKNTTAQKRRWSQGRHVQTTKKTVRGRNQSCTLLEPTSSALPTLSVPKRREGPLLLAGVTAIPELSNDMANIKGLSDINGDGSDDDDRKHNDYYAGGEKSGQLIRGAPEEGSDEEDRVGSIFQKAKAIGAKQGTVEDLPEHSAFRGHGRTLAGGPSAADQGAGPLNHVVKFYRNNIFTVDDGPSRNMDDPANLNFINSVSKGECPQELDPGNNSTEVTVNLLRVEQDYEAPKYVAFAGSGRTLRSSSAAGAGSSTADPGEWKGVDESQPTTSIQLRLYDGSRMVARMNRTHTVADIRRFIRAARPDMVTDYQLMTGFPPAAITDEQQTLEAAGLLNAVINQRK